MVRCFALLALACLGLCLPACTQDHHLTLFGYTTVPNYDTKYHTVRVPLFKNRAFTNFPGIEFDLTRAVINQIEQKTPYKVVGVHDPADTELLGTIYLSTKTLLNRNQLNEVREAEMSLAVELIWRDLKTGDILSQPGPAASPPPLVQAVPGRVEGGQPGPPVLTPPLGIPTAPLPTPIVGTPLPSGTSEPPPAAPDAATPGTPPPAPAAPAAPPPLLPIPPAIPGRPPPFVIVQSSATFKPELGESPATAMAMILQRLAVQIVSMMEKPW